MVIAYRAMYGKGTEFEFLSKFSRVEITTGLDVFCDGDNSVGFFFFFFYNRVEFFVK